MTTTVPEGTGLDQTSLVQRREGIQRAHEASVRARAARREADEAEQMAGALADRRAAADGLVNHTGHRLNAVRPGRPLMLVLTLRGRLGRERAERARAHEAATCDRDGVVAKVHAYLAQAADGRRTAEALAVQAAALPRMLDEIAILVRAEGGDTAGRLASSEAAIIPALQAEVASTRRLNQARTVQDGVRRALDALASAYAWGRYETTFGSPTSGDTDALETAVQDLLSALDAAARVVDGLPPVDVELQLGFARGGVQTLVSAARASLLRISGECERLEADRARALHDLATARAVRTAILRGAV